MSSITKNAGKACNNRLYRHIRTFEKIIKNYFVIYNKYELGCVNKPISHANEIMNMYKNTNKKNSIFYIAEMV